MDFIRSISCLFLAVSLLFIAACGRTSVTNAWKKSDYTAPPFKSLLVVALIEDPNRKMFWENTVAEQLRESGINPVATSISAFPNDRGLELKDIVRYVQEQKIGGVLVTRLVDIKKKAAPASAQGPVYASGGSFVYYNNFTTFYPQANNSMNDQRHTGTLTTVQLETNLYNTETLDLVWSMSSDTLEPRSINKLAGSVSRTLISTLRKDGLL